jgi:hypothetical protein
MWAHCSRSCSTFSIEFIFSILILNIRKKIWRHMSHYDKWGDLSLSCPHFGYLVLGYFHGTFQSSSIWRND